MEICFLPSLAGLSATESVRRPIIPALKHFNAVFVGYIHRVNPHHAVHKPHPLWTKRNNIQEKKTIFRTKTIGPNPSQSRRYFAFKLLILLVSAFHIDMYTVTPRDRDLNITTQKSKCTFFEPCVVIYICNKNQQNISIFTLTI